jgi:hypothetical protein
MPTKIRRDLRKPGRMPLIEALPIFSAHGSQHLYFHCPVFGLDP